MMPRVLVTGGAGYIGSHAAKALHNNGFEPIVFDNLSRGHRELVRFGPFVQGDIQDRAALRDAVSRWQPIACMHFAAFAYVAESITDPTLYYRNNVAGSLNLFDTLASRGVGQIVFSSTCAIYGQCDVMPVIESAEKRPMSPYGRSKLMVENILEDLGLAYGVRSVSLRYFNAAGADPDGEIGEMHDPEPHIIPRALMAATGELPFFEILGLDYPTADGTAVRDYIHVSDVADAHVLALRYLLNGGDTLALNLGLGRGYSVLQLIDTVEAVTCLKVAVRNGPPRVGDPAEVIADPSKARAVLGFRPRHNSIESMISSAWKWHQRDRQQRNGRCG
jgi:UDP-arabinose 4-epimerase